MQELLKQARNEKDVENAYRSFFSAIPDIRISSPFGCDGYMEFGNVRLLTEFKYRIDNIKQLNTAIAQTICYVDRFIRYGYGQPNVLLIADKKKCHVIRSEDVAHFLIGYDLSERPSSPPTRMVQDLINFTPVTIASNDTDRLMQAIYGAANSVSEFNPLDVMRVMECQVQELDVDGDLEDCLELGSVTAPLTELTTREYDILMKDKRKVIFYLDASNKTTIGQLCRVMDFFGSMDAVLIVVSGQDILNSHLREFMNFVSGKIIQTIDGLVFVSRWQTNPSPDQNTSHDIPIIRNGKIVSKKIMSSSRECFSGFPYNGKTFDAPQLIDGTTQAKSGIGVMGQNSLLFMASQSNFVRDNHHVRLLSFPSSDGSGYQVTRQNFRQTLVYFAVRKLVICSAINSMDSFTFPPRDKSKAYQQWFNDCLVFAALHPDNMTTSLDYQYHGRTYRSINHTFWISADVLVNALDGHTNSQLYRSARDATQERELAFLLKSMTLSCDARQILDVATELVTDSLVHRLEQNSWDAGLYQLDGLLHDNNLSKYKEFNEQYRVFRKKLIPGIFEYGIL